MTRKSKRELERSVEELATETSGRETFLVVYQDSKTDALTTERNGGERVDPDDHDADWLVIIDDTVVMERQRAEAEGREILGPFEDASDGRDVVRVLADDVDPENRKWNTN